MEVLMSDPVYLKNQEFIWSELGGEAVLLNVTSGDYFGLNEVGLSFWEKVDGHSSMSQIVTRMLEEYEVEKAELARDLNELASQMESNGLLAKQG
jgi:hypothetical protein